MVVIKDFLSGMNKKQKVPCFGTVCLKRFKVIDNFEKDESIILRRFDTCSTRRPLGVRTIGFSENTFIISSSVLSS